MKAFRCCLNGYLTKECANCPDWCDGSDPERGIGCGTHRPIAECEAFNKMLEEDRARMRRTRMYIKKMKRRYGK